MRRLALACAVACGTLAAATAAPARELAPLELALRRAAFELSSGRPDGAARAIEELAPVGATGERDALAVLLRAEAEILGGDLDAAWGRLEPLAASSSEFVRRQAAAHRLALAAGAWDRGDTLQVE